MDRHEHLAYLRKEHRDYIEAARTFNRAHHTYARHGDIEVPAVYRWGAAFYLRIAADYRVRIAVVKTALNNQ